MLSVTQLFGTALKIDRWKLMFSYILWPGILSYYARAQMTPKQDRSSPDQGCLSVAVNYWPILAMVPTGTVFNCSSAYFQAWMNYLLNLFDLISYFKPDTRIHYHDRSPHGLSSQQVQRIRLRTGTLTVAVSFFCPRHYKMKSGYILRLLLQFHSRKLNTM